MNSCPELHPEPCLLTSLHDHLLPRSPPSSWFEPESSNPMMQSPGSNPLTESRNPNSWPPPKALRGRWDLSRSSASSAVSSSSAGSTRILSQIVAKLVGCFLPGVRTSHVEEGELPTASGLNFASASSTGSMDTEKKLPARGHGSVVTPRSTTTTSLAGRRFTMSEIQKATKNFSPSCMIGQGAFGTVYKAKLTDGTFVAIKRANKDKTESDKRLTADFHNEISTLERIEHLNLVRYMGYLESVNEQIIIVEYVPNGTLREHLDCKHCDPLDFSARLDIAIDVAHAITYLHMYTDHPIIHRDIKSSNILLTENLRAKVADFGFARLGSTEAGVTHVVTEVKGTVGYLDPEYLSTNQLTDRSDVYSFGVVLVELISGRCPIEPKMSHSERVTTPWAMKKVVEGKTAEVIDLHISQSPSINLASERVLRLAYRCLALTKMNRPSMRRCGEMLWRIRKDYKDGLSSDTIPESAEQLSNTI